MNPTIDQLIEFIAVTWVRNGGTPKDFDANKIKAKVVEVYASTKVINVDYTVVEDAPRR